LTWTLHVEEDFSSAHHNGPPGHKCNETHGHDWKAIVEVTYFEVNTIGWGPDFGAIKALIKPLDHKDLNVYFDGTLGHYGPFPPSAENIAQWLYQAVFDLIGTQPDFVEVHEGGANRVTYRE
jgi:6-pyruvoyltetrahydropterin/6-carboxytetrahydropterin synthase